MSLVLLHTRYVALETLRVPVAVVGTVMFPVLSFLFFVVPFRAVSGDSAASTAATSQLALFAVFSVCLFTFGVGVAEDRSTPWEPCVRTLPVGAGPRIVARLLNGVLFALLGLLPLLLVAAALTEATVSPVRAVLGLAALAAAGTPLLFMGVAIGYSLPVKAAVPVAQLLLFPLAFGGGLFIPPDAFPAWLDAASQGLPTRAGRDLVIAATTRTSPRAPCRSSRCGDSRRARWRRGPTGATRAPVPLSRRSAPTPTRWCRAACSSRRGRPG